MTKTQQWLTPNSPVTPSALGALLVTVSSPLSDKLGISFLWITLFLSLGLGMLVVLSIKEEITVALKGLYWVFNSLLVFSVSIGIGQSSSPLPPQAPLLPPEIQSIIGYSAPSLPSGLSLELIGIKSALAQDPQSNSSSETRSIETDDRDSSNIETELTNEQRDALRRYLEAQKKYQEDQQKYIKKWSW